MCILHLLRLFASGCLVKGKTAQPYQSSPKVPGQNPIRQITFDRGHPGRKMFEEGKPASKEGIEGSTRVAPTRQGATCKGLKSCIDNDPVRWLSSNLQAVYFVKNDCWQTHHLLSIPSPNWYDRTEDQRHGARIRRKRVLSSTRIEVGVNQRKALAVSFPFCKQKT